MTGILTSLFFAANVLLIGDSISIGWRDTTIQELPRVNFATLPHNGGFTQRGLDNIDSYLAMQPSWDVIVCNWGLHDLRVWDFGYRTPIDVYESNLVELLTRCATASGSPAVIFNLTTPVQAHAADRSNDDVIAYNLAALDAIATVQAMGHTIRVHDLYSFVDAAPDDWYVPDGVHYTPEAYQAMGERIANEIQQELALREVAHPMPIHSAAMVPFVMAACLYSLRRRHPRRRNKAA